MRFIVSILVAAAAALGLSAPVLAQSTGPDFSAMVAGVDTTTVIAAVMDVGLILVGVILALMGVRIFLRMLNRGG